MLPADAHYERIVIAQNFQTEDRLLQSSMCGLITKHRADEVMSKAAHATGLQRKRPFKVLPYSIETQFLFLGRNLTV